MRELLVVLAMVGCVTGFVLAVFPRPEVDDAATPTRSIALVPIQEFALGDEFLCTVQALHQASPVKSLRQIVGYVRFAYRHPDGSEVRLLEVTTPQDLSWDATAKCQIWTLPRSEAMDDFLQAHLAAATAASPVSKQEEVLATPGYVPPSPSPATTRLHDALERFVPATLCETGLIVLSSESTLADLHLHQDFPLTRLIAALNSATSSGEWNSVDPQTFVSQWTLDDQPLSDEQQRALAQSLVRRLLEYFPQQESPPATEDPPVLNHSPNNDP